MKQFFKSITDRSHHHHADHEFTNSFEEFEGTLDELKEMVNRSGNLWSNLMSADCLCCTV